MTFVGKNEKNCLENAQNNFFLQIFAAFCDKTTFRLSFHAWMDFLKRFFLIKSFWERIFVLKKLWKVFFDENDQK